MKQSMSALTSQDTNEWYTPPEYIRMARSVMGNIDLDPASHPYPQQWIQANTYYVADGLYLGWWGRVWLNPPYNNGGAKAWTQKLHRSYQNGDVTQAILLCFAKLGYNWFNDLLKSYPTCLVYERIRFINAVTGEPGGQAKHGSAFVYFPNQPDSWESVIKFRDVFKEIGEVVL